MFPESVRDFSGKATNASIKGVKKAYKFTRSTLWILGTSFVILALPVLFEVERVQTEEAALMQQRQVGGGALANTHKNFDHLQRKDQFISSELAELLF